MLEFHGDAICLSGLAGTKLKSDLLGAYYPFWWGITSGGQSSGNSWQTAIIELHAGTGEVYIKDLDQVILGSAGHALDLKSSKSPQTENLKIVLVEENAECCAHLKNVIRNRWPDIPANRVEGPWTGGISKNVFLLNKTLDEALPIVENIRGNAIYFFDPLRNVEWETIEKVASNRIRNYYQTRTEFIIFLFTSDWFLGRDDFAPLPSHLHAEKWTHGEIEAVKQADSLMGNAEWRESLLCSKPLRDREESLIRLYKARLRKWFRYILPLPFNPKGNQGYHLIFCSNYEAGVRMTRNFYSLITNNPGYSPNSKEAYAAFKNIHPELSAGLPGNKRPLPWKLLWPTIREHEDGICDRECADFKKIEPDANKLQDALNWLHKNGYFFEDRTKSHWGGSTRQYGLDWKKVGDTLGIHPPESFHPISSEQLSKKILDAIKEYRAKEF